MSDHLAEIDELRTPVERIAEPITETILVGVDESTRGCVTISHGYPPSTGIRESRERRTLRRSLVNTIR